MYCLETNRGAGGSKRHHNIKGGGDICAVETVREEKKKSRKKDYMLTWETENLHSFECSGHMALRRWPLDTSSGESAKQNLPSTRPQRQGRDALPRNLLHARASAQVALCGPQKAPRIVVERSLEEIKEKRGPWVASDGVSSGFEVSEGVQMEHIALPCTLSHTLDKSPRKQAEHP